MTLQMVGGPWFRHGRFWPVKAVNGLIVSITIFSIVIGHPRAYFLRNWRAVRCVFNCSYPIDALPKYGHKTLDVLALHDVYPAMEVKFAFIGKLK